MCFPAKPYPHLVPPRHELLTDLYTAVGLVSLFSIASALFSPAQANTPAHAALHIPDPPCRREMNTIEKKAAQMYPSLPSGAWERSTQERRPMSKARGKAPEPRVAYEEIRVVGE